MKKLLLLLLIVGCENSTESIIIDRSGTYTLTSILKYEGSECSGESVDMIDYYLNNEWEVTGAPKYILYSNGSFELTFEITITGSWTQNNNNSSTLTLESEPLNIQDNNNSSTLTETLNIIFTNNAFYYTMIDQNICGKFIYTKDEDSSS